MKSTRRIALAAAMLWLAANAWAEPEIGAPAPDYLGKNSAGDDFLLSDYQGKVVVATFWASWCGPCQRELPLLEGMQKVFGPEKVKVVAVSIEGHEMYRNIRRAARNMSMEFIHDSNGNVSKAYGRNGVPHMVVVGKDGRLLRKFVGYSEAQVEKVIAQIDAALRE